MILLFGNKASKSSSANKNSNVKNHPVENSGILAMGISDAKSLLTMGEYDTYVFSNPSTVDYSMYSTSEFDSSSESGFMSAFSSAVAVLGDCGFSAGSDFGGCSASFSGASSCSSFSSVG